MHLKVGRKQISTKISKLYTSLLKYKVEVIEAVNSITNILLSATDLLLVDLFHYLSLIKI